MALYEILQPIKAEGARYDPGDVANLPDKVVKQLLAMETPMIKEVAPPVKKTEGKKGGRK